MTLRSMLLAAALVATGAVAQAQGEDKPKPAENSNQPPTADAQKGDPKRPKSYGYGEQTGDEAGKDSPRQASDPGREKSKMPQDQRADSGKAGAKGGKDLSVSGRIVEVSPERVSVRGEDEKVQTLAVTEKTVVLREGQRIEVSRLKAGDDVRAAVEKRGDQTVATRITVETGDAPMQQGTGSRESVDTPDQAREGIGGHIENTHPEPEDEGAAAPSGRP
jgi:Cu/Ag efflux protein CusF